MFLFLSKLLPLFFYPLGLACLLLIVALVLLWKKPGWAAGAIALALVVLLVGSNGWFYGWIVRSLEWQNIPRGELPKADAIVVLGGGVKSAFPPRPAPDLAEEGDRVFYAAQLYREGKAAIVIASGGRIEWRGSGEPESQDMAKIMADLGVPASAISQDTTSLNTYENAVNVAYILAEKNLGRRILLVTSAMHMPRSLLIFKKQGMEPIAAPTDFLVTQKDLQESTGTTQAILLNLIPDADRLQKTTRALKEYVGLLIYWLRGWI